MKHLAFFVMMLVAFSVQAQKQPKPNLNKLQNMWKEGKIAEAKEMADLATTFEKTKDDGKTWYLRGLVYATIDTSSNEQIKSLHPDAYKVALESFEKADSMAGKSDYFIAGADITQMQTKAQQIEILSNYYLDKGIKDYQNQESIETTLGALNKSINLFENQLKTYPNDTLAYYVAALVGHSADSSQLAIDYGKKYFEKGGTSKDIHLMMYQIYTTSDLKDEAKALEIIREAKAKNPTDATFPKLEIEMLINSGKQDEAKAGLEEAIKKEPNDKLLHFFLGYVNVGLKNYEEAGKNFENALKIDPNYFQAQYYLAITKLAPIDKINQEYNALGNSAADSKKRTALVQQRVKASEEAIPYFEKAEKMEAPEQDSQIELLERLKTLYYYVADDANLARVNKKLKALGVEE